jgi:hypothetical protein
MQMIVITSTVYSNTDQGNLSTKLILVGLYTYMMWSLTLRKDDRKHVWKILWLYTLVHARGMEVEWGGVRGLQRPAPYAQENLRHWGQGHKREINQAIVLVLEKKCR